MSKIEIKKKMGTEIEIKIQSLIDNLKKYDAADNKKYYNEIKQELDKIRNKFISIGKPAVPQLINLLKERGRLSRFVIVEALGEIRDKKAIKPLFDGLEELELGPFISDALKKFGHEIVPEVIKKINYRIAHPIEKGEHNFNSLLNNALNVIGDTICNESSEFLNKLLDDFIVYLKETSSIPDSHDQKYINLDFFHLLDCMVRQQDKRTIPFIKKARDFFPKEYVDYEICQIAIDRINKGEIEGYLPMEAMDLALPFNTLMDMFLKKSGGIFDVHFDDKYDDFDDEYDDSYWDED